MQKSWRWTNMHNWWQKVVQSRAEIVKIQQRNQTMQKSCCSKWLEFINWAGIVRDVLLLEYCIEIDLRFRRPLPLVDSIHTSVIWISNPSLENIDLLKSVQFHRYRFFIIYSLSFVRNNELFIWITTEEIRLSSINSLSRISLSQTFYSSSANFVWLKSA